MGELDSFGALLRRYRGAAGLTQEMLAERAGLSVRGLSDLERGVNRAPHAQTVQLLAAALGLSEHERAALESAARRSRHPSPATLAVAAQPARPQARASSSLLVGRVEELRLLDRHLQGEGPPILVLAGEPGIGKTRLLEEAARRATVAGWQVLSGGCTRRAGQQPYAPLLDTLQRRLAGRSAVDARTDLRGCAWLVRLLPELAGGAIEPLPGWNLPPEQERRLMFAAVERYLANVAGPAGTVLVLDDLQWAGTDALDLLMVLARGASATGLRFVCAYRDTDVQPGDPLAAVFSDLAHAGLVLHHAVGPLDAHEAGDLLARLVDESRRDDIAIGETIQRTGGVPFFLVSYAREPRRRSHADVTDEAPWSVAHSIRQRLAVLPAPAREMLEVASVVGRVASRALLSAVAACPEAEVIGALDSACQSRLLTEEGAHAYRFAHDVVREVVEADLGAARRAELHRRAAEVLEQQPGERPVALLAYHFGRGHVHDKAALYLEEAGDRAQAQYAHAAAEGYYAAAIGDLEQLGRQLDAARLCTKAGAALRQMARYDGGQVHLERAAEIYRAQGEHAQLIRTVAEIGRYYFYRGRFRDGLRWLEPQVRAWEAALPAEVPVHSMAPLYQALGFLYFRLGRPTEALPMTARSVELVREVDTGSALATALYRHAVWLMDVVGRTEEARGIADEALRIAEAVGDLNALHWSLHALTIVHQIRGEWEQCWACADRAVWAAERRGDPGPLADLVRERGWVAYYMGDWVKARRDFDLAGEISHQIGAEYPNGDALARLPLAHLALVEGEWEIAERSAKEHLDLARQYDDIFEQGNATGLLAELDLRMGRAAEADARLASVCDSPGAEDRWVTPLLVLRAWAQVEMGAVEAAQATIDEAQRRFRADDERLRLVDALRVQAIIHARTGHRQEAVDALEEGLALAEAMPYPYGHARLLHLYGDLLAGAGESSRARERLEAALAIFRRLGARKDAEQVAHLLDTFN